MSFPKLNLACTKDELRPTMMHVLVQRDFCYATNGHIACKYPTSEIFEDEFIAMISEDGLLIHNEDWAKMVQGLNFNLSAEGIIKVIYSKKRPYLIQTDKNKGDVGTYPDVNSIMPHKDDAKDELNAIGINFEIAATVQKAMNWTACRLQFSGVNRSIILESIVVGELGEAIVMPVMIHRDL